MTQLSITEDSQVLKSEKMIPQEEMMGDSEWSLIGLYGKNK